MTNRFNFYPTSSDTPAQAAEKASTLLFSTFGIYGSDTLTSTSDVMPPLGVPAWSAIRANAESEVTYSVLDPVTKSSWTEVTATLPSGSVVTGHIAKVTVTSGSILARRLPVVGESGVPTVTPGSQSGTSLPIAVTPKSQSLPSWTVQMQYKVGTDDWSMDRLLAVTLTGNGSGTASLSVSSATEGGLALGAGEHTVSLRARYSSAAEESLDGVQVGAWSAVVTATITVV